MNISYLKYCCAFFCFQLLANLQIFDDLKMRIIEQVQNPHSISYEEYKNIEALLHSINVDEEFPLVSKRCVFFFKEFKFVGDSKDDMPLFETIHFNKDPSNKKRCIVTYVSYNDPYPEYVKDLINTLHEVGFDGHLIYRIGGYPNIENGSLDTLWVPYAFKAASITEAYLLGYENVLWLDSSMVPLNSLNKLFNHIEEHGYFTMGSATALGADLMAGLINKIALKALEYPHKGILNKIRLTTPVFGVSLKSKIGKEFLNRFNKMAKKGITFFSCWVDELVITAIMCEMGLPATGEWLEFFYKEGGEKAHNKHAFFKMRLKRPKGRVD